MLIQAVALKVGGMARQNIASPLLVEIVFEFRQLAVFRIELKQTAKYAAGLFGHALITQEPKLFEQVVFELALLEDFLFNQLIAQLSEALVPFVQSASCKYGLGRILLLQAFK